MSSHTIHQTTKPNYTIVPKPLAHANSLKSNKETSTDMSLENLKHDGNKRHSISTEPGKEYYISKVDLKLHTKMSVRQRLGKNHPANFLTEGSSDHEEEILTLNGLTGRGTSPAIITHNNGVTQGKEDIMEIRRPSSKEVRYYVDNEIVEEEREEQVYSENAFKESPELRKNIPYGINQEDLSESRDSDREPSMNAASALKVSRISYYGADSNVSNYGIKFGGGLHDQSSRLSYRRERSMENLTPDNGSGLNNKNWKLKSISDAQLPKVEISTENKEGRGSQKLQEVLQQRSIIKNKSYERGNKMTNMISEDDIIIEELKGPRRKDVDENNHSKEILDIQDLKKFNLLDDLDKIYNQLDSRNLAI